MTELIFATGNKGKLAEVQKIFENTNFKIISLYDLGEVPDIEETGSTFAENAVIKAEAIYSLHKLPVIADDSGLAVEQLNGEPGIYSARYAGENCTYDDNNKKLIKVLQQYDTPHKAKFVCSAIYYDGENKITAVGELPGKIISEFRGTNGFGYDPIFVPDGFDRTLAELTTEEKNKISHRAKAFNKLKTHIEIK
ncbi:Nucleoside 5-triphosphatase RdgB (dHAPTP, dITP, XTP-specific) [hydrothermal vent metagenome]|uniref:dITP/XTP pyrophosphatase n=1 Tax=hydrothermal vent metagenome TaxID=652676 RepID=A0A3B1CQX7_9ZZZZ